MKVSKHDLNKYFPVFLDLMNNPSKFMDETTFDGWFMTDLGKELGLLIYYYNLAPVNLNILKICLTAHYYDFETVLKYVADHWEKTAKNKIEAEIMKIEADLF